MPRLRDIDFKAPFAPVSYVEENLSLYRTLNVLAQ